MERVNKSAAGGAVGALVLLAGAAQGQLIASDGFDYAAGGALTVVGVGGTGWVGQWNPAAPGDWTIDSIGSSYTHGGVGLLTSGRRLIGTSAAAQRTMAVSPALGDSARTVWVGFLAQQLAGSSAEDWLGVKLPCRVAGGVNSFLFLGKPYGGAFWGTDAGSVASHRQTAVASTTRAFIVARVDLRPGADDVHVWINPGLASAPALGSADLSLPAYGNFEGITKAIAEVGGGNGMRGTVDELRIGSTFRDVAPVRDGVLFQGREVTAVGGATATLAGDAVSFGGLGGPEAGARVDVDSMGSAVQMDFGVLAPGQGLWARQLDANGLPVCSEEITRLAGGAMQLHADFTGFAGSPPASMTVSVYDEGGARILENTSPDMVFTMGLPDLMLDLPCPGGGPRFWYRAFEFVPGSVLNSPWSRLRVVWRFGCGEGSAEINARRSAVVLEALFPDNGGTVGPSGSGGGTTILGRSGGGGDGVLKGVWGAIRGAWARGLSDSSVTEQCDDGSRCTDWGRRRMLAGGSADGIDAAELSFDPVQSVDARVGASEVALEMCYALSVRASGQTVSGPASSGFTVTPGGLDGAVMTPDLSDLGVTTVHYTFSRDGVVLASGDSPVDGLALMIPRYVNAWVRFWCQVGPTGGLSAQFENYGALGIVGGGGTVEGNQLELQFVDGSSVLAFDGLAASGSNLPGPVSVALDLNAAGPSCAADFNRDGFLDFFDYIDFVGGFERGDPSADFNRDGFLDFFDYGDFVGAFEVGC